MSQSANIVMPKLGLTMTEGLLSSWRVAPGDDVREGDVLFVVETEKVANEIEANADGRIGELIVPEGETVPVGAVVATWSVQSGAGPASADAEPAPRRAEPAAAARPKDVSAPPAARPAERGARIIATPLARRMARENGVDLSVVSGTGPRGRIKLKDVLAAQAKPAAPAPKAAATPVAGSSRRPATAIEKVVARRLGEAKQTIPHFYVHAEADVTRLLQIRAELNAENSGPKLTLTHFIAAAVGRALRRIPEVDAVWDNEEIVTLGATDVGIAVDTERGLLVPVLRNAGSLPLGGIAAATTELVQRARDGRLAADDLQGGAISISNVGMFGASYLVPIVNPGQSAILGVAATKQVFRPDADGRPVLKQEMGLVLSCDHRLLDGVKAARFLDLVVRLLQQPLSLLMA